MSRRFVPRILVLVVLAAAGVGTALAVGDPIVKSSHNAHLGAIVVNAKGLTLYHLTSEHGKIACAGACTSYWPPVLWTGKGKPAFGAGLKAAKLGTIKRPNGKLQVTYNKFPLYTYYLDKKAGQTNGQGVSDGPGTWYAISTAGTLIKSGTSTSTATTTAETTTTTTESTTTGDDTTTTTGVYHD